MKYRRKERWYENEKSPKQDMTSAKELPIKFLEGN